MGKKKTIGIVAMLVAGMAFAEGRAWFREARFGMFIHWGVYSIPAKGEWSYAKGLKGLKVPGTLVKVNGRSSVA